jgi:ribosomal protein L7/L12
MPDDRSGWRRWSWHRPVRITREAPPNAGHQPAEQLAGLLDERGRAEVEVLLAAGKPIPAVRRVRELTGLRLIDAKRLVESLQTG